MDDGQEACAESTSAAGFLGAQAQRNPAVFSPYGQPWFCTCRAFVVTWLHARMHASCSMCARVAVCRRICRLCGCSVLCDAYCHQYVLLIVTACTDRGREEKNV